MIMAAKALLPQENVHISVRAEGAMTSAPHIDCLRHSAANVASSRAEYVSGALRICRPCGGRREGFRTAAGLRLEAEVSQLGRV